MSSIRLMLLRSSVALNACLILYLSISWSSNSPLSNTRRDYHLEDPTFYTIYLNSSKKLFKDDVPLENIQTQFPSGNSIDQVDPMKKTQQSDDFSSARESPTAGFQKQHAQSTLEGGELSIKSTAERNSVSEDGPKLETEFQEPPREVQEAAGVVEPQVILSPIAEEAPNPPLDSQERKMYPELHECSNHNSKSFYTQTGEYWILNNYIPAAMGFRCDESITYTTHGDYTFLDNLDPLTSRWQGPVSVAVFAPGNDFQESINTILYLRNCMAEGIKKYVTFHLFFHSKFVPKKIPTTDSLLQLQTSCDRDPPKWTNVTTFRQQKNLLYPVNIARNTARLNVLTYFVVASDIELYPSINFIPEFFNLLKKPDKSESSNPRVYVFPIFEVAESIAPPETKAELQELLKVGKAISFHKRVCARCHSQPNSTQWQKAMVEPGLSVFVISHRLPPFDKWEPIYVGTNKEPIYDERLSWEGKSDKMSQMYILCLRSYEFHILDTAFLVHRPGIKQLKQTVSRQRNKVVARQSSFIKSKIGPEYRSLYGYKKGCAL